MHFCCLCQKLLRLPNVGAVFPPNREHHPTFLALIGKPSIRPFIENDVGPCHSDIFAQALVRHHRGWQKIGGSLTVVRLMKEYSCVVDRDTMRCPVCKNTFLSSVLNCPQCKVPLKTKERTAYAKSKGAARGKRSGKVSGKS